MSEPASLAVSAPGSSADVPGDHRVMDALVGWRTQDWDVRAALSNIADKTYYSSATSAGQIQVGDPRSPVVTGT